MVKKLYVSRVFFEFKTQDMKQVSRKKFHSCGTANKSLPQLCQYKTNRYFKNTVYKGCEKQTAVLMRQYMSRRKMVSLKSHRIFDSFNGNNNLHGLNFSDVMIR